MKRIAVKILVPALALWLGGCAFLDEDMRTEYTQEQIYSTEQSARAVLLSCYSTMGSTTYRAGAMFELGANSVTLSSRAGSTTWRVGQLGTALPGESTYLTPTFRSAYLVINTANDVLDNIHHCNAPQRSIDQIVGEAKFIRAVAYFDMVRLFGRIPLRLTNEGDNSVAPRAPIREVYDQIVSDLKAGAKYMPEKGEQTPGQPFRWAAHAFLAKVYTTMACLDADYYNTGRGDVPYTAQEQAKFWEQAYLYADSVDTKSDNAYSLTTTYQDLWNNRPNTDESILELQHRNPAGPGSWVINRTVGPQWSGDNRTAVSKRMEVSLCPNVAAGQNNNWGRITVTKFAFAEHWTKYGDPAKSLKQINSNNEANCDPRINVNYLYYNDMLAEPWGAPPSNPRYVWPHTSFNASEIGTWNFIKKYAFPEYVGSSGPNANDLVYRFADLLLIKAEAANELGNTTEAIQIVNRILKRARTVYVNGTDGPTAEKDQPASWSATLTRDEVRWAIMWERQYELLGELHELFDCRRRGIEYMKMLVDKSNRWMTLGFSPATYSDATLKDRTGTPYTGWNRTTNEENYKKVYTELDAGDDDFFKKCLYFPVPWAELHNNTAIDPSDQNFGWPL